VPFNRPSLTDIIERIQSDFSNRVENAKTFLRRSFYIVMSYVLGGAIYLLYEYIQYVKDQLFITYADAEYLERHAAEYGLFRDSGTKANGTVTFTGTVGTVIPAFVELITDDGLIYKTTVSSTIGAGGTSTATIQASEVGIEYNQDAGLILSFLSPIANIDSSATVDSNALTDGEDLETDDLFRARVLKRKKLPPHGGNANDYETWALEFSGVTRAWSIPEYNGIGTIGLVTIKDNESDIFPNESEREEIRVYIVSHTDSFIGKEVGIPVTAEPGFFIINAQALTMNFNLNIYPNTTAIQSSIDSKLSDLIIQSGGPEQNISISQMYESIMSAEGIIRATITSPTDDTTANVNEVHVLGTTTYSDY